MLPICILTIQDEDDRAYMSRLFVQYHRLMYQCTYEVLDDKWATEDAVQTTLLRLIDRIDVVRQLDESKLPGYIAAACRHTAYNVLRHNRRHPQVPLEDAPEASSAPDMDELLSRRVELNALARVWPRLDEDTRWLLEARYILDYSDSELAREMGFLSVEDSRPDLGLSHTIALGMAHMQDMDAVLFQVSDQPLLRRDSVERLVEVYRSHPDRLVALGHDGVRGNPCLFPELLALEGDHGGSAVIRRHEDRLLLVEASPRELTDVDTPQALEVLTGEKTV